VASSGVVENACADGSRTVTGYACGALQTVEPARAYEGSMHVVGITGLAAVV
jgi:hypothetical protein